MFDVTGTAVDRVQFDLNSACIPFRDSFPNSSVTSSDVPSLDSFPGCTVRDVPISGVSNFVVTSAATVPVQQGVHKPPVGPDDTVIIVILPPQQSPMPSPVVSGTQFAGAIVTGQHQQHGAGQHQHHGAGQHQQHGAGQHQQHGAGQQSATIEHPFATGQMKAGQPMPPGHTLNVYDGSLSRHYQLPSEDIVVTVGAMRYAENYNEYGRYSRYRFQLCGRYTSGKCTKGSQCTYIHASRLPPDGAPNVTTVHLLAYDGEGSAAKRARSKRYPMLQAGYTIVAKHPNESRMIPVPSELVVDTVGGRAAIAIAQGRSVHDAVAHGATPDEVALIQLGYVSHCVHFHFRRLCNLGTNCRQLHSTIPLLKPNGEEHTLESYTAETTKKLHNKPQV